MTLDETVYIASVGSDQNPVAAIGLKMANWHRFLVGLYFYGRQVADTDAFIQEVLHEFGEASLYAKNMSHGPALICKMNVQGPLHEFIGITLPQYRSFRLDLLELRTKNPRPFINLRYDREERKWRHAFDANLAYLPTGYSYIEGYDHDAL